jgi:hypothetical protein
VSAQGGTAEQRASKEAAKVRQRPPKPLLCRRGVSTRSDLLLRAVEARR